MRPFLFLLLICIFNFNYAQINDSRLQEIKQKIKLLSQTNKGYTEAVKTEINVNNITLSNFLIAISELHKVNINVSPELNKITMANNFNNVNVADLLVFLCKEYNLTIDFTGNILSIKKFNKPVAKEKERLALITYNPSNSFISIDVKENKLYDVFKLIMDESGKNLVFSPDIETKNLTAYIKQIPFDKAMENLAFANNLLVEKTKDGYYSFESSEQAKNTNNSSNQFHRRRLQRSGNDGNFTFEILDKKEKLVKVNFENTPIAYVINDIGKALNIDVFTATPLDNAGNGSFSAKSIGFDSLLDKLFEGNYVASINSNNDKKGGVKFTYKKEGDIYYFGTENQLSVRAVEIIHLQHRSIELLTGSSGLGYSNMSNSNYNNYDNTQNFNNSSIYSNQNNNALVNQNQYNSSYQNNNRQPINTSLSGNFNSHQNKAEALINILPDELKNDLEIKVDNELNSFYVNGPSGKVQRFKNFIKKIDQPVPVVLIEVMLIEVSRNATIETGVSWGIGNEAVETTGAIYPETDLTLGAKTVNKVIGGFDGFGSFNLGKVVPNFFATIKAMESNGNLKIRSTPKLSTLNGHRATFSNGQTSYYAITQRNIYGTDNPQTSEITNYAPIAAELGLSVKPLVSGDGQVTLDIFVVQSSFGSRIAEDAPPDISSRQFSSVIRVQDQDIVVLGGLEEQSKNNSGSGVPLLSKIPLIKWLFSKRKRESRKAKLTVLIKPTVIY